MKKRFSGTQIVAKLRQADVLIGQGKNGPGVVQGTGGQPADLLSLASEIRWHES